MTISKNSVSYTGFMGFLSRNLKGIENSYSKYYSNFAKLKMFILERTGNIGFRPNVHCESGVLHLIEKIGLGHLVEQHSHIDAPAFEQSVNKALKTCNSQKIDTFVKDKLYKATSLVIHRSRFGNKKFRPTSILFGQTQLNSSSGCGFGYSGSKGANRGLIISNAQKHLDEEKLFCDIPLILGYRLQLRDDPLAIAKSTSFKIRIIFMYTAHFTLIESIFALPFIIHYLSLDDRSFYTIGKNGHDLGKMLRRRLISKKQRTISLDVSAWDQSLPNWLITSAFYVLRHQLQLTAYQSKLFDSVVQYFCCSPILHKIYDININLKRSGLPSGSYFTNLIGTLCHAILLAYIDEDVVKSGHFLLCSDDNIFCTNRPLSFFIDAYLKLGLVVNPSKCDVYRSLKSFNFLGYTWINFKRHINLKLALNQCVWHSEFRTDLSLFDREVSRCASVLLNGYNGIPIFKKLFPLVIKQLNAGKDIKFLYMYTYSPPTKMPSIIGIAPKLKRFESLKIHLLRGPDIR